MNDRELLELAARVAGYHNMGLFYSEKENNLSDGEGFVFSPLTDDGDALRLAVELGFDIGYGAANSRWALHYAGTKVFNESCEINGRQDPYAATRRAIVRAAAKIGKIMEDEK